MIFRIAWQSVAILLVSAVTGLLLNSFSDTPLPLARAPRAPAAELWTVVTAEEVQQALDSGEALFIDARDPNEYALGRIPGAINLPSTAFQEYFEKFGQGLPMDYPFIVYCQGGECDQSHEVLEHLKQLGFQQLSLYEQGWEDWKRLGKLYETDQGMVESTPASEGVQNASNP